jgi:pyruvate-formate lyase/deferrochelatase/peroxidase EfeB
MLSPEAAVLTPEQSRDLSGQRNTVAEARQFSDQEQLGLRYAQSGLPYVSEHAVYLTTYLKSPEALSLARLKRLAADLLESAYRSGFKWVATVAVSFPQWRIWTGGAGSSLDELFEGEDELRKVLDKNRPPYAFTGGDLFFHIQAREMKKALDVKDWILEQLAGIVDAGRTTYTIGDSLHGGRVYGGRLLHGLIGSVDPVCFSVRAVIGDELPEHKGGCFCLTQRFIHDWQQLAGMSDIEMENLIGRDHGGNMVLNDDARCHVKLARVNDEDGVNYRLVGQSQPFRKGAEVDGGRGREEGVYQLSYAKSVVAFARILQSLIGDKEGYIKSRHFHVSHADMGSYWYVPSAPELGLPAPHSSLSVPMNEFFDIRSSNGRLYYNTKDYLHRVGNRVPDLNMQPMLTDRVVELLGYTFSRWHDTWYRRRPTPELGHLAGYVAAGEVDLDKLSLAERKGLAVKKTLELLSSKKLGREFDTYRIHPRELIVGAVPDYTLGSGYEAMRYLNEPEQAEAFLLRLDEAGAAGHNVPNYKRVLDQGLGALLDDVKRRRAGAKDAEAAVFYQSVIYALEGVQTYLRNYSELAKKKLAAMRKGAPQDRENLKAIAERMSRLATEPPKTFLEAAQLVFTMHCCMHISGESVSIGRLDQLLEPYLHAGEVTADKAQEIIDCFWIKMDEKVLLNHRHFSDRLSRGSGAITYQGGDFPQGAALNQWVQQVTVGGYMANAADPPEDACNDVTRMCLRAARRLPLNAPCLSLRVHARTPSDIIAEAAACVVSGGGHPFLINDDKLIAGLLRSGEGIYPGKSIVSVADARDMVCDGCFESLFAGKCEFAFSYVPVPDAIEMALNRGRTYAAAGPVHLTGLKASFRSKSPEEIRNWEEFHEIFLKHYRYKLIDFYDGMLSRYGNLSRVCPSPLLSPLIDGCLESGRDLTAGGARYRLLAPLMNGISCAVDSLWAIRSMVFSDEAVFTLPELAKCLICDWGYDMKEPFYSSTSGDDRIAVQAERFRHLRMYAHGLPKFGQGHKDVDRFARDLIRKLVDMAYDLIRNPQSPIAGKLQSLRGSYGAGECPFEFVVTPGIATFEDYAGVGSFLGASADGRRSGDTVASDFSPSPTPSDLPVHESGRVALPSLASWAAGEPLDDDPAHTDPIGVGLSNGSPVDINIRESFPLPQLETLIRKFALGNIGPNMMSITCADPVTLAEAQRFPERYDLVRNRMGGWSEFFVAMFPHHQEQHKRRPIFEAGEEESREELATPWRSTVRAEAD